MQVSQYNLWNHVIRDTTFFNQFSCAIYVLAIYTIAVAAIILSYRFVNCYPRRSKIKVSLRYIFLVVIVSL